MRGSNNYIDYSADLSWNPEWFAELWEWADVVHSMETLHNLTTLRGTPLDKPLVLHHHGTRFRDAPDPISRVANAHGIPQIASTVDLTLLGENVSWMPNPTDTALMEAVRRQYALPDREMFTVGHAPTNRFAKGTDAFLAAFAEASQRRQMKLNLCERLPWMASLASKARNHVYFDQDAFGFGLSAMESWSMGVPVIGHAASDVLDAMRREWGSLPFIDIEMRGMADLLVRLADDPDERQRAADEGFDFVMRHHDYPRVVERLKALWTRTRDEYKREMEPWV